MAVETRTLILGIIVLAVVGMVVFGIYQWAQLAVRPTEIRVETVEAPVETAYLRIKLYNLYNTSTISGASVYLFDSSKELLGMATSTAGVADIGVRVSAGRSYYVWITKGNTLWEELITIRNTDYDRSAEMFIKEIRMPLQPPAGHANLTLTILDPDYNKIGDGGEYNVTTKGNTRPIFTILFKNQYLYTRLNKVVSSLRGATFQPVLVIRVTGTGVRVTGLPTLYTFSSGDEAYYVEIPPENTACTKDPLTGEITSGSFSTDFNVDAGSLESGSSVTITITLYANLDVEFFKDNGRANDNAVSLLSLTFYIKA